MSDNTQINPAGERIAKAICIIFHPLLMPTYGMMFIAFLSSKTVFALPLMVNLEVIFLFFVLTFLLPALAIYYLFTSKRIGDLDVSDRKQRNTPYVVAMLSALVTLYLFGGMYRYLFIVPMISSYLLCIIAATIENHFTKVSVHAMACGAMNSFLFMINLYAEARYFWLFVAGILVSGLVCSARLFLNRHNEFQVLLGFISGICITFAAFFVGI